MAYTQNDFQKKLAESGLADKFSQWDMDTAMQHPDFGMSILSAKQDYNSAATPEQKLLANERANALRRHYGYYSGGSDGSQYISTGRLPGQIDGKLEEIGSFGSFDYGQEAPSYNNAYAREQQRLLDSIINRPEFSWSKETDPQWSSYKKSYLREGERATADALGQASAASGGRPSSYAVNAAAQAGDYYATKLNDVIPTLYQQAYDRYLKEFQMQQQALDAVNGQEQLDYNRYLTELGQYNADRDFAYNAYTNDYNRLLSQLGAFQGEEDRQYGRYNDSVDRALQLDALTRERQANEQNFYQQVLDTMLQSGASPSQELVTRSGYPSEYVQALENLYKQQALSGAGGRSGGSSGGSGKSGGGADMDYDGLFAAAMESGHPRSFISNNYKKFGFSSNSGLWSDYQSWAEGQENDPVTAFNNGDQSNSVIEQLLAMGYTQKSLEDAGYTGDYFGKGNTAKKGSSGGSKGQNVSYYSDSSKTGIENKVMIQEDGTQYIYVDGMGAMTPDQLIKAVDRGVVVETEGPGGMLSYRRR